MRDSSRLRAFCTRVRLGAFCTGVRLHAFCTRVRQIVVFCYLPLLKSTVDIEDIESIGQSKY